MRFNHLFQRIVEQLNMKKTKIHTVALFAFMAVLAVFTLLMLSGGAHVQAKPCTNTDEPWTCNDQGEAAGQSDPAKPPSSNRDTDKNTDRETANKTPLKEIATTTEQCEGYDSAPEGNRKIYGGVPAPDEVSTVGITFIEGGVEKICTGVLIDKGAVLTAGHCSCGKEYKLYFGEKIDDNTAIIEPTQIIKFKGYDCRFPKTPQPGVDYGLLKFEDDGTTYYEQAEILPPALAQESALFPNASLRVVGYGQTENNAIGSKRMADIPVLSWYCAEAWAQRRACRPFKEMILSELARASYRPDGKDRDSCGGDSGGPAFARAIKGIECNKIQYKNYLVGITSRGVNLTRRNSTKPCGGGGVYEVVARNTVMSWLRGHGVNPKIASLPVRPKE